MKHPKAPERFRPPHSLSDMPSNTPILVAYSGGADSGALLELICHYGKQTGAPIYAAHVHHGIRGEEADRDEAFCRERAAHYGVELLVCHADVPALAKESGKSMETVAREVRYAFFSEQMKKKGIPLLCTAHHADDNLETILFHLARGSGTGGMSGIPETRQIDGGMLLRPLLGVSRKELLAFCASEHIPYVTDSTNLDTDYTRNHIRAHIVPALREMCSGVEHSASRLSYLLRQDATCLDSMAEQFLQEYRNGFSLPLDKLCNAPYAIASRGLMRLYRELTEDCSLAFCHVNALLELTKNGVPHAAVHLPHGILAVVENGNLCFYPKQNTQEKLNENTERFFPLSMGENKISALGCKIIIEKSQSNINIYKTAIKFYMDFDTIEGKLFVRCKQSGDHIRVRGMTRSVKKCWNEQKIPMELRRRLPILCDSCGILAVPYIGVRDDSYRSPQDTEKNGLCISIYLNE